MLDHFYGGAAHAPIAGRYIERTSPLDGRLVSCVAEATAPDVDRAVESAAEAFPAWRRTSPSGRGRLMIELARRIREASQALVPEEVEETGKLAGNAAGDIEGAAQYFEFYGEVINGFGGETIDLGPSSHSYTIREPYGVVGVITPWNLPINQAARAVAPAIASGNTAVLKPSSLASTTSIRLAEMAIAVGIPSGVINVVLGSGANAGPLLVNHPTVRKVAFTGSVEVGRDLARQAADRLIPMTLELGGKSANIVFADADLDKAATGSVTAFTANAGQVCSAGTRLLVQREIYDQFVDAVVAKAEALKPNETIAPVISETQFATVRKYLDIAEGEGAIPVTGGASATDAADARLFVPPTVYTGVNNAMRIAQEEVFGPVVVVIPFDDEADAVTLANDSPYGLVAGLWTTDLSRAHRVAAELDAGQVFINAWWAGGIQTPFGGYKQSGYGREKGVESLAHYTQTKSVTVAL
jgi:aldehyde dehydrogenase (NAD+)